VGVGYNRFEFAAETPAQYNDGSEKADMKSDVVNFCNELGIFQEVLVTRKLREYPEAVCLEIAELGADGREYLLTSPAAKAWRRLKTTAKRDNISLHIVSAFRSIERQAEIVRNKLFSGRTLEEILAVSSPPGFSEHHTGCAVDIGSPGSPSLEIAFEESAAFHWLETHANDFGFYLSFPRGNDNGYQYEPWHWCFKETDILPV
jgi:D-alanyl-D-alanine carboxypeptidase